MNLLRRSGAISLLLPPSGCGGAKVLKEPEPLSVTQSLSAASDKTLSATLDWVIFRDGPGTCAKNVDWDEYMIGVQNVGEKIDFVSFFPLSSSPRRIEISYVDRQGEHALVVDTQAALDGLHLVPAKE